VKDPCLTNPVAHVKPRFSRGDFSRTRQAAFLPLPRFESFNTARRSLQLKQGIVHVIKMARDEDEIDATALTLLFKYGKYTILLFAEPLMPFSTIKSNLLTTLKERYPQGLETSLSPNRAKLPDSILDIVLGVPKDTYDPSKGWDELNTRGAGMKESPRSLGLKDGSQIAFAFVDEDKEDKEAKDLFHVEYSDVNALYPDDE